MKKPNLNHVYKDMKSPSQTRVWKSIGLHSNLRVVFILAFVIGLGSIVHPLTVDLKMFGVPVVPVVVMLLYVFYSGTKTDDKLTKDQIGDSQYYLGFLLTLGALAVSMVDLAENSAKPDQSALVGKIGVALITSIIGLFGRMWTTHFEIDGASGDEIAEQTFRSQAREIGEALSDIVKEFKGVNQSINQSIRTSSENAVKRVDDTMKSYSGAYEDHVRESSEVMKILTKGFEASLTTTASTLQSRLSGIELVAPEKQKELTNNVNKIMADLLRLSNVLESTSTSLDRISEGSNDLANFRGYLGDGIKASGEMLAGIKTIHKSLGDIADETAAESSRFKTLRQDAFTDFEANRDAMSKLRKTFATDAESARDLRESLAGELKEMEEISKNLFLSLSVTLNEFSSKVDEATKRGARNHSVGSGSDRVSPSEEAGGNAEG
jgi:hypothetical protein